MLRWALSLCVLAGAAAALPSASRGAAIGPETLIGNAEVDFPSTADGVLTLVNPRYPTVNPEQHVLENKYSTGWSIKDIRLRYDSVTDRMLVGVNFFGIAGDADSNGNPGQVSAEAAAKGAIDIANLGGRESITVGFDLTNSGRPTILAGVPGDKRQAGDGLNGFTVSLYKAANAGLAYSYGTPLAANAGELLFNPSAEHPDFIFAINNFSQLPGYDPANGFGLVAFAGSPDDTFEEEGVLFSRVAAGQIPEPATLLGWGVALAAGAVWRVRRRSNAG